MAGSIGGSHSPCTGVDIAGFRKENTLNNQTPSKGLEWLNLLLGSGLALAAFAFAGETVAAWNAGIVGTLIACCAAVALYRYGARGRMVQHRPRMLGGDLALRTGLHKRTCSDVVADSGRQFRCVHRRDADRRRPQRSHAHDDLNASS